VVERDHYKSMNVDKIIIRDWRDYVSSRREKLCQMVGEKAHLFSRTDMLKGSSHFLEVEIPDRKGQRV
jgi:hypothetical protein